jgi:hypothetical protein
VRNPRFNIIIPKIIKFPRELIKKENNIGKGIKPYGSKTIQYKKVAGLKIYHKSNKTVG